MFSPIYIACVVLALADMLLYSVNEIFDPDRVDGLYSLPEEQRLQAMQGDRGTNYGVVRLNLLERLYEKMYHQSLHEPNKGRWPHQIVPLRAVIGLEENQGGEIVLQLQNTRTGEVESTVGFDAVLLGTGYVRNAYESILKSAKGLLHDGKFAVGRDYGVIFKDGAVAKDSGVWLQGCNEKTHGVS